MADRVALEPLARRSFDRRGLPALVPLSAAVAVLLVSLVADRGIRVAAGVTLVVALATLFRRALSRLEVLLGLVVVIVLFVPIRRYEFASGLPFDLEPYRMAVAVLVCLWVGSMLAARRPRLRGSFMDGPLVLFLFAVLASLLANMGALRFREDLMVRGKVYVREDLAVTSLKALLFLVSFYLVYYVVVSVVRDAARLHMLLKTLVGGGAVVGLSGLVEARAGYNVFDHLEGILPGSTFSGALGEAGIARGGRLRVYGSAQHPIALAMTLVMLLPLSIYLALETRRGRWWLASAVLGLSALATLSRTGMIGLVTILAVVTWLRPHAAKQMLPFVLPALVVVHLAVPGAIGTFRESLTPSRLIAEQTSYEGRASGERLGTQVDIIKQNPTFGQGFGTRVTESGPRQNARVLDNQWLGTATETGLLGAVAWLWFFGRFVRRAGRVARDDDSWRGRLLTALAASVAAFAIGMATFDAFSFIQVAFVMYLLVALGAAVLAMPQSPVRSASIHRGA